MVFLYSGTPGSGKSLHVASRIYYWLRLGRPVIANFEIDCNAVSKKQVPYHYCPNDKLTPDFLIRFAQEYWDGKSPVEDRILLVIDECQLIYNAREWQAKGRDKWLSFYTQHRKYGYQIILVAQFDRMIDRQIRSLIEYEVIHRKVSNYGLRGKLLSLAMGGNVVAAVKMWYPLRERVGCEIMRIRRKYYRLYDTYKSW